MRSTRAVSLLVAAALVGCAAPDDAPRQGPETEAQAPPSAVPEGAEALSFLGEPLTAPRLPETVEAERQERLREAELALEADPEGADALIWMGRRLAYLGQYGNTIDLFGYALGLHPDDARLYRHRGHRYVTVRQLDAAIADLEQAVALTRGIPDEVEPDGLPNAAGVPTSTLQFNIWYHLGLAHYLKGDFAAAADAYAACADVSVHPDSEVATAYWRVMTLKRLSRNDEADAILAGITPDMAVIESGGYLDLLLLHKGERTPEELIGPAGTDATLGSTTAGYGVGAWYLINGDTAQAEGIFRRVLSGGDQWAAFGFIAAEAELARLRGS